jgi:hypothetical protein
VAVFGVLLLVMAAYTVDLAYMELVKTELRAATDSAAKAGTFALVQGGSVADIQTAAIQMAAMNNVSGKPLVITASNITLGQSVLQADGTWLFVPGLEPYQSVQVTSSMSAQNANGSVPLFFAPVMGINTYSPTDTAVASANAAEVCLVLDRSASMCWDESGVMWSYPPPIYSNIDQGYESPPQPGCRWLALQSAVGSFCSILTNANGATRVAAVTWASPVGTNSMEYELTGQTSPGVTEDVDLTSNMNSITNAVNQYSTHVMLGATDMCSGLNEGIAVLSEPDVRPFARKIIILMTDGQWNTGNDPMTAAQTAANNGIVIHCVCFLQNADQTTCQNIAELTGGQFYFATDSASLTAAFQQLAHSLPVSLTQ